MGLCKVKLGAKPSEAHKTARKYFDKSVRRGINQAFVGGSWVSIRSQVRPDHEDAITCIRCWSDERAEPTDPRCPVCQGTGWISSETYTGYRLRVFAQAHIPETVDQYYPVKTGQTDKVETRIWVNFTERPLQDGDLIAHIEPDNLDEPKYIKRTIRRFEVIESVNAQLHPGINSLDNSNIILAQDARVDQQNIDRPETFVDMDENMKPWQLSWDYPSAAILEGAYA